MINVGKGIVEDVHSTSTMVPQNPLSEQTDSIDDSSSDDEMPSSDDVFEQETEVETTETETEDEANPQHKQ